MDTELIVPESDGGHHGGDEHHLAPAWAMVLAATLAFIFCIVGFVGNMLTILALPYTRKLRNAATWFVLNLAATELLFCVTILPMSGAHLLHLKYNEEPLFEDQGCKFFVFLRFVIIQAELLSIAAIAVNRCILIAFPKKYHVIFTTWKTCFIIIAIWVSSFVVMVFPLTGTFGSFAYNSETEECDFDEGEKLARKVLLALGFLLPCVIVIASYSYIFYKARQSAQRLRSRMNNNGNSSEAPRPATGLRNRDMRIARTIGAIFLSFIICCTPVSLAHFYLSHGQYPAPLLLLHPLYWFQYCLNIFIYVLMNKQYREAYINYIGYWCPSFKKIRAIDIDKLRDEDSSTSVYKSQRDRYRGEKRLFKKFSNSLRRPSKDKSGLDSSSSSQNHQHQKRNDPQNPSQNQQVQDQDSEEASKSRSIPRTDAEFRGRKVSFATSPPRIIPHETNLVTTLSGNSQHSKNGHADQKDFDVIVSSD